MFSAAGVAEVLHHGVIDSIGSSLGYIDSGPSDAIVFPLVWAWVGRWAIGGFRICQLERKKRYTEKMSFQVMY